MTRESNTGLPFDPIKALDLEVSHRPPDMARMTLDYLPLPATLFQDSHVKRFSLLCVICVDPFGVGLVVRLTFRDETHWLQFVARCILLGLEQPCAVIESREKSAAFIRNSDRFRSGFTRVREHPLSARYREAAV